MPVGHGLTPLLPPVFPACRGSFGKPGEVNVLSLGRYLAGTVLQAACVTGW